MVRAMDMKLRLTRVLMLWTLSASDTCYSITPWGDGTESKEARIRTGKEILLPAWTA